MQLENHRSSIKCRAVAPDRPKFKNWLHYVRAGAKHYSPLWVSVSTVTFLAEFVKGLGKTYRWKALSPVPGPQSVFDKWEYDADFVGPFQEKISVVEAASSKPSSAPSLTCAVTVSLLPQLFMPGVCQHFISDSRAAFTLAELKTFLDRNSG